MSNDKEDETTRESEDEDEDEDEETEEQLEADRKMMALLPLDDLFREQLTFMARAAKTEEFPDNSDHFLYGPPIRKFKYIDGKMIMKQFAEKDLMKNIVRYALEAGPHFSDREGKLSKPFTEMTSDELNVEREYWINRAVKRITEIKPSWLLSAKKVIGNLNLIQQGFEPVEIQSLEAADPTKPETCIYAKVLFTDGRVDSIDIDWLKQYSKPVYVNFCRKKKGAERFGLHLCEARARQAAAKAAQCQK